MKDIRLGACLTLALGLLGGNATAAKCVLPLADGGEPDASPPTLVGTIAEVSPDHVLIQTQAGGKPRAVTVTAATELYTVYGGGFEPSELKRGQHALIWYQGCAAPKKGRPVAVVLQVCSMDSQPCPD